MDLSTLQATTESFKKTERMPVFFIGHGDPMNALRDNPFTQSLGALGKLITERPQAILVISAHWLTRGTFVCTAAKPETIYDFGGFPDELYQVTYPAQGAPTYANEVERLIPEVKPFEDWGLDHGAWTILKHMFPEADIPVFQLSIDYYQSMQHHFDIAQQLRSLRDKGVLIIGSGNIVHNLRAFFTKPDMQPFDWTIEFDAWVKSKLDSNDYKSLLTFEHMGAAAKLAVPTVDHYAPLIYSIGSMYQDEHVRYTYEENLSSISMRCFTS